MENQKQVSSYIVGINSDGSMTLTDAAVEGQTPLAQEDMMEYTIIFAKNLETYKEEQRLVKLIEAATGKTLGGFLKAIKESTQQITGEIVKETPDIVN